MAGKEEDNKKKGGSSICCSKKFLTIFIIFIAIFFTFIPDLTYDHDITLIERTVNFFVWTAITIDHFIHCTLKGELYYSVDFNENPYSIAEPAFYLAEKVRLWVHSEDLPKWQNDHNGRNYDMTYITKDELLSFKSQEERINFFKLKTDNYLKPLIIKNWVNKDILNRWHMRNLANNYSNETVSTRQWEGGCELGHIDKTYRKSLACEVHNQNLKSTLDGLLNGDSLYGLAHTIVSHKSTFQKNIFDDFQINEVFYLFDFYNKSAIIPQFIIDIIPENVKNTLNNIFENIKGKLPKNFDKLFKPNMFDEMTALFANPTYWYKSVPKYKEEQLDIMNKELEFVRRQGAQLHNAFLGNIFANVEGRKLWLFISPEYSIYLRGMSSSYGFATFSFIQHYLFKDHFGLNASNFTNVENYYNKNEYDYNIFKNSLFNQEYMIVNPNGSYKDLQKYSSFKHMKNIYETIPKYEILLNEGDILYFPPFWWHCVKNYASLDSDKFDYAQEMNYAIANRLIFTFKAFQTNYYDWVHSMALFSFKQIKALLWGVEVNMPKID